MEFAGWETITQLLAGNFPHYLAGSWNFTHFLPGIAEHLFFPATSKSYEKRLIHGSLSCFCVLFFILQIIFVGCPS